MRIMPSQRLHMITRHGATTSRISPEVLSRSSILLQASPSITSKSASTIMTSDSCYVTSIEDDDSGPFNFHEPQDLNPYSVSRNVPISLPPWTVIQQERIRIPKPSLQNIPVDWNDFHHPRRDSKSFIEVDRFSSYSEVILELKNRFSKV